MHTVIDAVTGDEQQIAALPPLVSVPTLDDYRMAIQRHLDETANQRGYDSGVTCTSYVGSTNIKWAAEAAAFAAWRDAVWAYAYSKLAEVQSGQQEPPDVAAFIAALPVMAWPNP